MHKYDGKLQRDRFNLLELKESPWNFFPKLRTIQVPRRRARKSETRFLTGPVCVCVFCMLIQNRARCTDSAILTAIASCRREVRGRGGGAGGRNILRARDYQYARDTASPFFLGERKREQSYSSRYFAASWRVRADQVFSCLGSGNVNVVEIIKRQKLQNDLHLPDNR